MAVKISALAETAAPADADVMPVVEVGTPETKKLTIANLRAAIVTQQHAYEGGATINASTGPLQLTRSGAGNTAVLHGVQTGVDADTPIASFEGDHAGAHVAVLTPSGTTQDGVRISDGAVTARYGPAGILGSAPAYVIAGAAAEGATAAGVIHILGGASPAGATGAAGAAIVSSGKLTSDVDAASVKGATTSITGGDAADTSAAGGTAEGGDVELDTGAATSTAGSTVDGTIRIGATRAAAIEVGRSGVTAAVLGDLSVAGMLTAPTGETVSVVGDKAAADAIVMNASDAAGGVSLRNQGAEIARITSQGIGLALDGSDSACAIYRLGDVDNGLFFDSGTAQLRMQAGLGAVWLANNAVYTRISGSIRLQVSGSAVDANVQVRPSQDAAYALGTSSRRWSETHSQKIITKTTASGYAGSDARLETANATTTNATTTDIWTRQLGTNEMLSAQILVQGHKGDEDWASYVIHAVWYCTSPADAALKHSTEINAYESTGAASWGVTLDVGGAGDVARIRVTGAASTTISWQATVLASAVITGA